jgi:hypothetical protein
MSTENELTAAVTAKWDSASKEKLAQAKKQQAHFARWHRELAAVMTESMLADLEFIGSGGKDDDELLISFSNTGHLFNWTNNPTLRDAAHAELSKHTACFFKRFVRITASKRMPTAEPEPRRGGTEQQPADDAPASPYRKYVPIPGKARTPERIAAGEQGIQMMRRALGVKRNERN